MTYNQLSKTTEWYREIIMHQSSTFLNAFILGAVESDKKKSKNPPLIPIMGKMLNIYSVNWPG